MKLFVPDYYEKFKCIADRCRHSCCVGWEIDIDSDTLEYYKSLDSEAGQHIMATVEEDGVPHFRMDKGERCPHLDGRGLCRIITSLGEDALCDICSLHPRYRCDFSDRVEMGLGMCCEEACRIILSHGEKCTLVLSEDDGEPVVVDKDELSAIAMRDEVLSILQDRSMDIDKRIKRLGAEFGFSFAHLNVRQWSGFYKKLENLDPKWGEILEMMEYSDIDSLDIVEKRCEGNAEEQLIVYYIFRHLPTVLSGVGTAEYLKFALLSFYMIRAAASLMCDGERISLEALCEAARLYSSEIEYSDENVPELLLELSFT